MRILFYRYGSICEEDILDCFKKSGHEVTQIDVEIYDKSTSGVKRVGLISEALNNAYHDCVFTINFYPDISDLCNIYHIRYITWIVDSPVLELFAKPIANEWNRVFIFDRIQYEEISKYNPANVFHYPLAVNTERVQNIIKRAKKRDIQKFSHDISFVGSLYSEKNPLTEFKHKRNYIDGYIDGIIEAQLKVYGYYFVDDLINERVITEFKKAVGRYVNVPEGSFITDKEIISQFFIGNGIAAAERKRLIEIVSEKYQVDLYTGSDTSAFSRNAVNHGFAKTLTEMPIIFNKSRINLNPTSKAIRSGIPLRVFDIMACGGFLLSNYQTELSELFKQGEDFVCYESLDEVPELIDYYLSHENERKEIAYNGFRKVMDNYSYMLRLNGLLLKAFEI